MARVTIVIVAAALAAVPGAAARTDLVPKQVVRSADGRLTLTIPAGALAKPAPIRIRTVARGALSPAERALAGPGAAYQLTPAGLRFRKPITVKLRGRFARNAGVPALVLGTRDASGRWTALARQRVARDGAHAVVTATTTHFSRVAWFDERLRVSITPQTIVRTVGETFDVRIELHSPRLDDFLIAGVMYSKATGVIRRLTTDRGRQLDLTRWECVKTGRASFGGLVSVDDRSPESAFVGALLWGVSDDFSLRVEGEAVCLAPLPLEFSTSYRHLGAGSSCVRADIIAASGATLHVAASSSNGYAASGTLQLQKKATATAHGTFDFRIAQLGRYTIAITAAVGGRSVTKSRFVDVTEAQGTSACR